MNNFELMDYLYGDTMRKSNCHLFVTFALMDMFGPDKIKDLDCLAYMECYLK